MSFIVLCLPLFLLRSQLLDPSSYVDFSFSLYLSLYVLLFFFCSFVMMDLSFATFIPLGAYRNCRFEVFCHFAGITISSIIFFPWAICILFYFWAYNYNILFFALSNKFLSLFMISVFFLKKKKKLCLSLDIFY